MGRIHLCHQKHPDVWYILEENVDYIGAMSSGKVSIIQTDDVVQADSISELCHKLQEADEDFRWFCELGWIDSKRQRRLEMYPQHREIHVLRGFVPDVCDFRINENPYLADWKVDYVSELWYLTSAGQLDLVRDFRSHVESAVNDFIWDMGLMWEDENGTD